MMEEIGKKFSILSDELGREKTKRQKKEVIIYFLLLLIFLSFGVIAIQKLVKQEKDIKRLASRPPIIITDTVYIKSDSGLIIRRATANTALQRVARNTSITFDTKQTSLYYSIEAREATVLDSIQEISYFSADTSLDKQTLITNERYKNFFQEWKTRKKPLPITITILYKDGRREVENITN